MKIAVAGTGYVGLSIAALLSRRHSVTAVDVISDKVDMINRRESPIQDAEIERFFREEKLDLVATLDGDSAYRDAEFVVVSTPTNYDPQKNYFDTSSVESVIRQVNRVNPEAVIVIKSTIPVGYTAGVRERLNAKNVIFSPEFLREGKALWDNLYPSRIIVGAPKGDEKLAAAAKVFAGLLAEGQYRAWFEEYAALAAELGM